MKSAIAVLTTTAVSIGVIHTLIGPDHYAPFVAMAQARKWSRARLAAVTILCGLGHVLSSVILGAIGIALGITVGHLNNVESARGELAGWALMGFGLAYTVWGVRQALRNRPHTHIHLHGGHTHAHDHVHHEDHAHLHPAPEDRSSITTWVLFTVFILGPCEPLIPILMYPAATHSVYGVAIVATAFSLATIATMLVAVFILHEGLLRLPFANAARYSHALAGASILACGLLIHFGF